MDQAPCGDREGAAAPSSDRYIKAITDDVYSPWEANDPLSRLERSFRAYVGLHSAPVRGSGILDAMAWR